MKFCVPYGNHILAVFFMRKIPEIVVFFMVNSMCSLCRILYGNFFVFVVDGVPLNLCMTLVQRTNRNKNSQSSFKNWL